MGKYAGVNNICATKGCGHFVADHTNLDPKTNEVDRDSMTRWGCHANGTGCTCTDFIDGGSGDAATDAAAQAAKSEADAKELAALREEKAKRDAAAAPAAPAGNP